MTDDLRARIARALYAECQEQDAYVETGDDYPGGLDPADSSDITVDGRLVFAGLADAVIRDLGLTPQRDPEDQKYVRYVTEWVAE